MGKYTSCWIWIISVAIQCDIHCEAGHNTIISFPISKAISIKLKKKLCAPVEENYELNTNEKLANERNIANQMAARFTFYVGLHAVEKYRVA
jgi:hypothetical protein